MKYEKPEVVLITSAVLGIQGCTQKGPHKPDCDGGEEPTVGAYEADE
jgi:hypothetical protein